MEEDTLGHIENEVFGHCVDCESDLVSSDDAYSNEYDDNVRCDGCNDDYIDRQQESDDDSGDIPCRDYEDKKLISRYKCNTLTDIVQSCRGFGVEIEAYGKSYMSIEQISENIDNRIGISGDGSLNRKGFELQFPLINGKNAENMVKDTCRVMKDNLAHVDDTCGYHIHLQCLSNEQSFVFIQRLMFVATIFDDIIMSFLPKSRRANRYCNTLRDYVKLDLILQARCKEDLELVWYKTYNKRDVRRRKQGKYDDTRYHGFNFHCYLSKMKHLEVRHHQGTLNAEKILHWANLHTLLLDAIRREVELESDMKKWKSTETLLGMYDKNYSTNFLQVKTNLLFDFIGLNDKSRDYFTSRQASFNL